MSFTENPADFINADTPGYVLATIGGMSIGGIFDNGAVVHEFVSGNSPSLTCAEADVTQVEDGFDVVIAAKRFKVRGDPQFDGTGMAVLLLEKI